MSPEDSIVEQARTSCLTCRKSKRRCDKKLPSCHLCVRKDVECTYPTRRRAVQSRQWSLDELSPAHHSSDTQSWDVLSDLPVQSTSHTEPATTAIYFIAPQVFQQARLELLRPELSIPTDVTSVIGDLSSIRCLASTYFDTIHKWLPILSKQGFFSYLLNPLARRTPESSLLALCMNLCCTAPKRETGVKSAMYHAAKRFHHEAESIGILSISILQAGVLIAFYEISHAVYPAAYLSVGACARYGLALGIDRYSLTQVGDSEGIRTRDETEEMRRVWWAILMFDRFLSLSNPSRALSTEDPTFDTFLPIDDLAWDLGTAKREEAVRISTGSTQSMGSFATLARATYLLSQALRIMRVSTIENIFPDPEQTAQLRRTLLALVYAADREANIRRLEFCAQSGHSLSTILLLEEHHLDLVANIQRDQPTLQNLSAEGRTAIDRLVSAVAVYNTSSSIHIDSSDNVPIFIFHAVYQVACVLLRLVRGQMDTDTKEKLEIITEFLGHLNKRWKLAAIYLKVLEAKELTITLSSIQD